jgi:hypothetical protein
MNKKSAKSIVSVPELHFTGSFNSLSELALSYNKILKIMRPCLISEASKCLDENIEGMTDKYCSSFSKTYFTWSEETIKKVEEGAKWARPILLSLMSVATDAYQLVGQLVSRWQDKEARDADIEHTYDNTVNALTLINADIKIFDIIDWVGNVMVYKITIELPDGTALYGGIKKDVPINVKQMLDTFKPLAELDLDKLPAMVRIMNAMNPGMMENLELAAFKKWIEKYSTELGYHDVHVW